MAHAKLTDDKSAFFQLPPTRHNMPTKVPRSQHGTHQRQHEKCTSPWHGQNSTAYNSHALTGNACAGLLRPHSSVGGFEQTTTLDTRHASICLAQKLHTRPGLPKTAMAAKAYLQSRLGRCRKAMLQKPSRPSTRCKIDAQGGAAASLPKVCLTHHQPPALMPSKPQTAIKAGATHHPAKCALQTRAAVCSTDTVQLLEHY